MLNTAVSNTTDTRSRRWSERNWQALSAYLPALLMGLLALASYGILESTAPTSAEVPAAQPVNHQPDFIMQGFAVRSFDAQGRLSTELNGQEVRHYPGNGHTDIVSASIQSNPASGGQIWAQADQIRANDQQTQFVLRGQVHVTHNRAQASLPGQAQQIKFQGEELLLDTAAGTVRSEQSVKITRGHDTLHANRMLFNERKKQLHLEDGVTATLEP